MLPADYKCMSATHRALQREESRRVGVLQQMDCLDVIGGAVDAADFDTDFALLVDGNEVSLRNDNNTPADNSNRLELHTPTPRFYHSQQFVAQQQQLLEQELISHADTAALALESQLQEALVRQAVEAEKRGAEIDKALDLACDRFLATAKVRCAGCCRANFYDVQRSRCGCRTHTLLGDMTHRTRVASSRPCMRQRRKRRCGWSQSCCWIALLLVLSCLCACARS